MISYQKSYSRRFHINKLIVYLFVIAISLSSCKSIICYDASKETPNRYQELITYYLPKTVLNVKIPIVKNVRDSSSGLINELKDNSLRNSFKDFFYINYGWNLVDKQESTTYELGKNFKLIPQSVPDTNKCYTISYKEGKTYSQNLNFSLSEKGILSSGNFAQKNMTYEYTVEGIKLVASTAGEFFSLGETGSTPGSKTEPNPIEKLFPFIKDKPYHSNPKIGRIFTLTEELKNLADKRSKLIGSNMSDMRVEYVKHALSLLDKRIEQIRDLLMGSSSKKVYWLNFYCEPPKNSEEQLLLKIDKENGVTIPESKKAMQIINEDDHQGMGQELKLHFELIHNPTYAVNSGKTDSSPGKNSGFLRYNIPAEYKVYLTLDDKSLKGYKSNNQNTDGYTVYFPQKGKVGVLPSDFSEGSVELYEDIGALKEISYKKEPIEKSELVETFGAIDSLRVMREKYIQANQEVEEETEEEVEETVIRVIFGEKEDPDEDTDEK